MKKEAEAMGRYRLYWSKRSGAFPVAVMLETAGLDYEAVELSLEAKDQHAADYLKINPRGQVPTLLLPDGQVMTESAAICLYLGDRHSESGLLPAIEDPARAKVLRWLVFAATQLYEDDLRIYYPDRYTAERGGAASVKAAALAAFERHTDLIEAEIAGPFLLGQRLTILDTYLAMLMSWHPNATPGSGRFPRLAPLAEAVRGEPRVAPVWQRYEMDVI